MTTSSTQRLGLALTLSATFAIGACDVPPQDEESGAEGQAGLETEALAEVGVGGSFTIFDATLRKAGGVQGQVESSAFGNTTTSSIWLVKAPPNKNWGAIAHVDACRKNQGGARYRHDANAGSSASNEIWLDVRTDARGRGNGQSTVNFVVRPRGARSLVLYQNPAASGNVGARIACLDFPWDQAR